MTNVRLLLDHPKYVLTTKALRALDVPPPPPETLGEFWARTNNCTVWVDR